MMASTALVYQAPGKVSQTGLLQMIAGRHSSWRSLLTIPESSSIWASAPDWSACAVWASKKCISLTRMKDLVCFVSYLKVFTIWNVLRGRSACDLIHSENMVYIGVSLVGRRNMGTSSLCSPAWRTQ